MSKHRYWVIGGEFKSIGFEELIDGTGRIIGPFSSRAHAQYAWRSISEKYRSNCNMRFTIVEEGSSEARKTVQAA